jgi:hypothetical protein
VPAWLNDVTLYHNRGDTTFVGENDGFRIDTMKHVDDEFWRKFAPEVLGHAHGHGKSEFMMFGEVFDTTKRFTSHFTTQDGVQSVLDFPFQAAAQGFAASSGPSDALRDFFLGDDWYMDADSNVYQLPTFLGNHDMGRIGLFIRNANPGAPDDEVFRRDRLAHELMYFSRGNPVVYYGDEQGFVGDGGDQDARQDMFQSQVGTSNDDDNIATTETPADDNFDQDHDLYEAIARLASVTREHPALVDGSSFYDVIIQAKVGAGDWTPIGTDDNAPTACSTTSPGSTPGRRSPIGRSCSTTPATRGPATSGRPPSPRRRSRSPRPRTAARRARRCPSPPRRCRIAATTSSRSSAASTAAPGPRGRRTARSRRTR